MNCVVVDNYTAANVEGEAFRLVAIGLFWGAGVLFVKVAQHETRPLTAGRVLKWLASLWLWPLLLLARRPPPKAD
jgi:hypothetical protein